MKALLVKETLNFERGGNILRKMDIGMRGFNELKRGDVLQCIKRAWVDNMERLKFYPANPTDGYFWEVGNYGILRTAPDKWKDKLIIELIGLDNDNDVKETSELFKKNPKAGVFLASNTGVANPNTWNQFFKVIRLENLQESMGFQKHKNPLKSLGVGLLSMTDVKTGDIIRSKMEFSVKKINRAIGPSYVIGDRYPGDIYFYVVNATPQRNGDIGMHLEPAGSLKHAKEIRDGVPDIFRGDTFHTWASLDQWEWYFEPLQRSQY